MTLDPFAKIRDLLRLAGDARTPPNEAGAAALAAAKRLAALTDKERASFYRGECEDASRERRETARSVSTEGAVRLADPFAVLQDVPVGLRVAKLTPGRSYSSHILFVPRRYVVAVEKLDREEVKAIGWGRSGNIARLVIARDYFEIAQGWGWDRWS